jgi:hypothetical protein
VQGAAIPAAVSASAVVQGQLYPRGTAPPPPPAPSTPGSSGELPWPPAKTPGAKIGSANGIINFAGYKWITKETNGGRVGPGNNVSDEDPMAV